MNATDGVLAAAVLASWAWSVRRFLQQESLLRKTIRIQRIQEEKQMSLDTQLQELKQAVADNNAAIVAERAEVQAAIDALHEHIDDLESRDEIAESSDEIRGIIADVKAATAAIAGIYDQPAPLVSVPQAEATPEATPVE